MKKVPKPWKYSLGAGPGAARYGRTTGATAWPPRSIKVVDGVGGMSRCIDDQRTDDWVA